MGKDGKIGFSGSPPEDVDKAAGMYAAKNPSARLTLNSPSPTEAAASIKRFLEAGGRPEQIAGLEIGGRSRPDLLQKILDKNEPDRKRRAGLN